MGIGALILGWSCLTAHAQDAWISQETQSVTGLETDYALFLFIDSSGVGEYRKLAVEDHVDMIGMAQTTIAAGGITWDDLQFGADVEVTIGGSSYPTVFITNLVTSNVTVIDSSGQLPTSEEVGMAYAELPHTARVVRPVDLPSQAELDCILRDVCED